MDLVNSPEEIDRRDDASDNEADHQQRENYAPPVVAAIRVR